MFKQATTHIKFLFFSVLFTFSWVQFVNANSLYKSTTSNNSELELTGGTIQIKGLNSDSTNFTFGTEVVIENVLEAQGSIQGYTYVWQKTKNIDTDEWSDIHVASGSGLNDGMIFHTTFYRRKVIDGTGTIAYSNLVAFYKLEIINQPSTVTQVVPINGPVQELSVVHSIIGETPTYQWYINSEQSNEGGIPINGATSSSFTPDNSSSSWGYYYVVITGIESVTSEPSGEVFIGDAIDVVPQLDPNNLPQYSQGINWFSLLYGDNFDPSNDVQQDVTDLVGNADNPMLQTQRDRFLFSGSESPEFVYYFRARHGNIPDSNGLIGSSFYLGIDVDGDQIADLFVEVNTKNKAKSGVYLHLPEPGADGLTPSTTAWQQAHLELTDSQYVLNTYLTSLSDGFTTNEDIDNQDDGDAWLEFAITESALSDFVNQAIGLQINGESVITLYVFTSMMQTANGDIAGINSLNDELLNQTWEDLGVTVTSSVNALIELITPTINTGTFSTTNFNLTGTWGGTQGGSDSLSISLNGQSYTIGSTSLLINSNQWVLLVDGSMVEAGQSYEVSATAIRSSTGQSKTATGTIYILDDNTDLASISALDSSLSLTNTHVLVDSNQEQIVLTAVSSSSFATMTVNGEPYTGGGSLPLNLNYGSNSFQIDVVAENQIDSNSYTIEILRGYLIVVSEIDSSTDEDGDTGTFSVVLPSQPSGDVVLNLSISDGTEAVFSTTSSTITSVTFTAENWNTPQIVSVVGIDDPASEGNNVRDGAQYFNISGIVSSPDILYNNGRTASVSMTNQDTDPPGFSFEFSAYETSESGTSVSVTISLLSTLLSDDITLTLPISISDDTEASFSLSAVLTSTVVELNNSQLSSTILIYGVDDNLDDGTISYDFISGDPVAVGDAEYDAITAAETADFALYNLDNDLTQTLLSYFPDQTVYVNQANFVMPGPDSNNTDGVISYSISPTTIATIDASTALIDVLAVGEAIITANQEASDQYSAATITATLTVLPLVNELYWADDRSAVYESPNFNIPIEQYNSTGTFTYSSSNPNIALIDATTGEITIVGAGEVQLIVSQASDNTYEEASDSLILSVSQASPIITAVDQQKNYLDPPFEIDDSIVSSTSDGPISYSSSNPNVISIEGTTATVHNAGSVVITAAQEASSNYTNATASFTITVNQIAPVLEAPDDVINTIGEDGFNLTATTTSDGALSFNYTNSNIAEIQSYEFIEGGAQLSIRLLGVGQTTVSIVQDQTANYLSATDSFLITVLKASVVIEFPDIEATYNDPPLTLSATSSSTGSYSFTSSDPTIASIIDNELTINGAGTIVITATQNEDENYNSSTATATLTILQDQPVLSLSDINAAFEDPDFNLEASSNSEGLLTYQIEDPSIATVSDSLVHIVSSGFTTVTVNQEATANYLAAQTTANFSVGAIDPGIVFEDHFATFGDASLELTYNTNSAGTVNFSIEDPSIGTISGTELIILGAGSTTLTLTQDQGQNYFSSSVTATLWVEKALTVISAEDITATYGDSPIVLDNQSISSSSEGLMSYTVINPSIAEISANELSFLGAGTTLVEITQEETANYLSATSSFNVTVNKATPLIIFEDLNVIYGDESLELQYTSTSSGSVNFVTLDNSIAQSEGSILTIVGSGSTIVELIQESDTNYQAAVSTMTLVVEKKAISISGIVAFDKVYDATTEASVDLSNIVFEGIIPSDEIEIQVSAEFESSHVGADWRVDLNSTYNGEDLTNYIITDQTNTTASITAKTIEVQGASSIVKNYDGTTVLPTTVTYEVLTEFFDGDDVFIIGAPSYDSSDSGDRLVVKGTLDLSGSRANNYRVEWTNGSGRIEKKELQITALDDTKFVTQEDNLGFQGVIYEGFVEGESELDLSGELRIERLNSNVESSGIYQSVLQPSGLSSNNYEISYINGDFTIIPADVLLISVENQTIVYGNTPIYTLSGSFYSSSLLDVIDLGTATFEENTGVYALEDSVGGTVTFELAHRFNTENFYSSSGYINVGSYELSVINEVVDSTSFEEIIVRGSLVVLPKSLSPTVSQPIKNYDGNRLILNADLLLEGLVEGDLVDRSYQGLYKASNAGVDLNYTLSSIQISGVDAANYQLGSIQFNGNDGVIEPIELTISALDVEKTYDGLVNENYPLDSSGFIDGEDFYNLGGSLVINNPAHSAIDVGGYPFEISGFESVNYLINYTGAQLEITPALLYIDGLIAEDKVYDGGLETEVDLSAVTYAGLIQGDEIQLNSVAYFETPEVGIDKVVSLENSFNGRDASNYIITAQLSSIAAITRAPLFVKADNKSMYYTGSVFSDFTVTYQGFVNRETSSVLSGELDYSGPAIEAISGGEYAIEVSGLSADNYTIEYIFGVLTIEEGDLDGDGVTDSLDPDIDGDGVPNEGDSDINGDGIFDNGPDNDYDGMNDAYDSDDDNDLIEDVDEPIYGTDPMNSDSDFDGVLDGTELLDNTNPLIGCDLIWENRTILEYQEQWLTLDCDGDGLINAVEVDLDTDQDGLLNIFDNDDDGDTLLTRDEGPDPNGNGLNDDSWDFDRDGTPDYLEKNELDPNAIVARDIEVFNAISPNGDGDNDYLIIRNIEKYPDNEIFVMNKDGKLVSRIDSYGKDGSYFYAFDESGEKLPIGIYYYVLRIRQYELERVIKGFLYINW